jgi:hypothetical protein
VKQGVPALFLVIGPAGDGVHAWQDYLQHHHHQPSDDLSQPFDWNAASRFAPINWLLMREIADADERPLVRRQFLWQGICSIGAESSTRLITTRPESA